MTSPSNSAVQNLLPVQAYFDVDNNFVTFIGQGEPFTATISPDQSGLNITNSTINSTTIGATTPSTGVFTNIATTTGTISTNASAATDIVNLLTLQAYAAGISWKNPVTAATLTDITLSGPQTIDGKAVVAGDTVLVKNQSTSSENGIYEVKAGAWTYAVGSTTWSQYVSALVFVEYGTQQGSAWYCTAQPGGTLGVTAMNWSNFSTAANYSAGTGLTLTGYQFSITNTGVPASTYGSATATPVFAVNAQGQITSVTNTTITPAIGSVTGLGTGVATWLATPTSANLAAAVGDETGSGSLVFATSPTLVTPALGTPASGVMTNVTGLPLTTGVTGTLPIGNGGTGQTTASSAFNALSPITTVGDLIYGSGVNTSSRLAIGSSGQVLSVVAGIPAWADLPAGMVYPGAGIPNSTGSAWGTSYTTTGSGTVVALATSPSFTTPILGTPQSGNFSSGTFTWPTFNQNTSGTAAGLSATLVVGSGGTGVTTLTGLAYGNGTSAFTAASAAQVVAVIGSTAVTNATNATNATSATTATNATNTAITDDTTTNATMYPTWVTTTTGNLPQKVSSTKLSFNPSTGRLTATSYAGDGSALTGVGGFPSGTLMLFVQTSAPTGWTKSTANDNKALRVVSGTASTGGSVAFTTAFASQTPAGSVSINTSGLSAGATTLSTTQIPSHSHQIAVNGGGNGSNMGASPAFDQYNNTQSTGGGGSHSHSISGSATGTFTGTAINLAVQYVDVIVATKD